MTWFAQDSLAVIVFTSRIPAMSCMSFVKPGFAVIHLAIGYGSRSRAFASARSERSSSGDWSGSISIHHTSLPVPSNAYIPEVLDSHNGADKVGVCRSMPSYMVMISHLLKSEHELLGVFIDDESWRWLLRPARIVITQQGRDDVLDFGIECGLSYRV